MTFHNDTPVACGVLSTESRAANIERRACNVAECHSASVLTTILFRISMNVTSHCGVAHLAAYLRCCCSLPGNLRSLCTSSDVI